MYNTPSYDTLLLDCLWVAYANHHIPGRSHLGSGPRPKDPWDVPWVTHGMGMAHVRGTGNQWTLNRHSISNQQPMHNSKTIGYLPAPWGPPACGGALLVPSHCSILLSQVTKLVMGIRLPLFKYLYYVYIYIYIYIGMYTYILPVYK